jgi:hypothetical protein
MKPARVLEQTGTLLIAALALWAAPAVNYGEIRAVERSFDQRITSHDINDPIDLLGFTRGVYLEGYGAVFTAEVNLVIGPAITPFRPKFTKEDVTRLREKKLARLPAIRRMMRDTMVSTATALKAMPPQEQVVIGVAFFHQPWEDTAGLPQQIVMQAKRQALADFEKGVIKSLDSVIKVQEY